MTEQSLAHDREDDLTKPTSFGPSPTPLDKEAQQTRIQAVLMTYCTPKLKYDGMSAWEIAGKIVQVLDLPPQAERHDDTAKQMVWGS